MKTRTFYFMILLSPLNSYDRLFGTNYFLKYMTLKLYLKSQNTKKYEHIIYTKITFETISLKIH